MSASAEATRRQPGWDNARWLAATLIVIHHLTSGLLARHPTLEMLDFAAWGMRVPVFCILAGYFSRSENLAPRDLRRLIESLLVPYLLFGLLHTLVLLVRGDGFRVHTVVPAWATWFLLSLLCWRIALPYIARLRYPLLCSVVLALVIGYVDKVDNVYSASRTVVWLPLFVIGWKLQQGWAQRLLSRRWTLVAAAAVITADIMIAIGLHDRLDRSWLRTDAPYPSDWTPLLAWTVRLAMLATATVVALSTLRLVPKRSIPLITYLGSGGLFVYLLHPLVLRLIGDRLETWLDGWWALPGAVAIGALTAAVLGSAPVRTIAAPIVRPRWRWLFRPDGDRTHQKMRTPTEQSVARTDRPAWRGDARPTP
ncbi:acyltransferase family protein [Microlunatus soli]|nr:acyltransferase family protein [Microlunatus soli]